MNKVHLDIIKHQNEFPGEEICGYVIDSENGNEYVRCKNIAEDKNNSFQIGMDEEIKTRIKNKVKLLVHSHPSENHGSHMSAWDRYSQLGYMDDWAILNSNFELNIFPPLPRFKGRQYKENVFDCATIVRDFYDMNGVKFNVPEHSSKWWNEGENIYIENAIRCGFDKISKTQEMQIGDVLLINYASKVPNHSLIYFGNNKMLHHQMGAISKIERVDRFHLKFLHSIWRHPELNIDWCKRICSYIKAE